MANKYLGNDIVIGLGVRIVPELLIVIKAAAGRYVTNHIGPRLKVQE